MRRLLIRPGGIGDVITSLPALESLRAGYTEVWVPTALRPLVRFADRVESIADTGLDAVGRVDVAEGDLQSDLHGFLSVGITGVIRPPRVAPATLPVAPPSICMSVGILEYQVRDVTIRP